MAVSIFTILRSTEEWLFLNKDIYDIIFIFPIASIDEALCSTTITDTLMTSSVFFFWLP